MDSPGSRFAPVRLPFALHRDSTDRERLDESKRIIGVIGSASEQCAGSPHAKRRESQARLNRPAQRHGPQHARASPVTAILTRGEHTSPNRARHHIRRRSSPATSDRKHAAARSLAEHDQAVLAAAVTATFGFAAGTPVVFAAAIEAAILLATTAAAVVFAATEAAVVFAATASGVLRFVFAREFRPQHSDPFRRKLGSGPGHQLDDFVPVRRSQDRTHRIAVCSR